MALALTRACPRASSSPRGVEGKNTGVSPPRRHRWRQRVAVLAVLLVAGCGASKDRARDEARDDAGWRMTDAPSRIERVCGSLAEALTVSVVCPSRLPASVAPHRVEIRSFRTCSALNLPQGCPLYALLFMYGSPSPGYSYKAQTYPPSRFVHFEMVGGRSREVRSWLGIGVRSGGRLLQKPLGTRTLGKRTGTLFLGLPDNKGGGQYGGHFTFLWSAGHQEYAASLHIWRPQSATLKTLDAIVRSMRVVQST